MNKAKLILVHGYMGAGKTTYAQKLASQNNTHLFTLDYWISALYGNNPPADKFSIYESRVKDVIWPIALSMLQNHMDVILDFGFWSIKERAIYIKKAEEINVKIEIVSVSSDLATMKKRVLNRTSSKSKNELFIDENAFDSLFLHFEDITDDEISFTQFIET